MPVAFPRCLTVSCDETRRRLVGRAVPLTTPVLVTARLRLRPFALSDAPAVRLLAGAREIADTTREIPHPYPAEAAEQWIATHAAEYERGASLTLAVELRAESRLCGAIGLRLNPADCRAELGYWIAVPDWGKGFCTEAARAVLDYGFATLGLYRITATYFVRNPASGRVLEKIGMTREGLLRQHVCKWGVFEDVAVCGLLRPEWEAARRF